MSTKTKESQTQRKLRKAAEGDYPEQILWQLLDSDTFWAEGLGTTPSVWSRQGDDSAGTLQLELSRAPDEQMGVTVRHVLDYGDDGSPFAPVRFRNGFGGGRSLKSYLASLALATATFPEEKRRPNLPEKLREAVEASPVDAAHAFLKHGHFWPSLLDTRSGYEVRFDDHGYAVAMVSADGDAHIAVASLKKGEGLPRDIEARGTLGPDRRGERNALRLLALAIDLDATERPERTDRLPVGPNDWLKERR